ncbi:hypothetical protein RDV64_20715 [Acuticoccus sp. MNP-M23]|uniref:hypothetical protein n=1 Tax=Acuticoccus sp. MNP-M23 TaxID=3072793 RepID=UPI002814F639|nr:hypothetical protein [Acuticoccus sp. MNP-M23]WMS42458.1 hypothetical protein RDV64_20715 [Acuticoccus sp. MNP-M23]
MPVFRKAGFAGHQMQAIAVRFHFHDEITMPHYKGHANATKAEIKMNAPTIIGNNSNDAVMPDDYEVLTRLLEYAMAEADRHGEAYCAALISRAVDALSSQPREIQSTAMPSGRTLHNLL